MTQNEIKQILDRQRAFFHTGATLDVSLKPTCVKPDLY